MEFVSKLRSRLGLVLAAVAALVAVGLAIACFVQFGTFVFFFPLFNWLSSAIFGSTGLNLWLVKGFSVFATLGLLVLFRGLFARDARRRLVTRIALVSFLGLAYIGMGLYAPQHMFFDYRTGQATRWYARTPEGVRVFDEPGYDPKYGIPLQPVTPQIVAEYASVPRVDESGMRRDLAQHALDMGDYRMALDYLTPLAPTSERTAMLQRIAREAAEVGRYDLSEKAVHLAATE